MNRKHVSKAAQTLGTLTLALSVIVLAAPAGATVYNLQAGLTGAQEVPAVTTSGAATLSGIYNDETNILLYTVSFRLDSLATRLDGAHLHAPANATQTAPPVVDLDISHANGTNSFFDGVAVLDANEETQLKGGLMYVNLHSDRFPNGELRAQLSPQLVTEVITSFPVTPGQETTSVALNGATPRGLMSVGFDAATRRLTVGTMYTGLTSNASMAHLHGPAPQDQSAGVIFTFASLPQRLRGVTVQRFSLTTTQVDQLRNNQIYFNLHTANNPNGEIRGQLILGRQAVSDLDGDGLTDEAEYGLATSMTSRDTDGDTIEDGVEWGSGTNPLTANGAAARTDTDSDLLPNAVDTVPSNPDSDGDGFLDGYEVATGTNPRSAASRPALGDIDRNGRVDNVDAVFAVAQFIGQTITGPYSPERGDANRDGTLDNVDIVLIYNFFLGNIKTLPQASIVVKK